MPVSRIRVHPSSDYPPREKQLAWLIASLAESAQSIDDDVAEMVSFRLIDSLAVALAAINRRPVVSARAMALAHPLPGGGLLFGLPQSVKVSCEWAAFANGVAVRELDYNDTFLAADYAHPSDAIAPLLAVAQQTGCDGLQLTRAIAVAYEVHVALGKAIDLHSYKKDHVAHLAPAIAAGLGNLLSVPAERLYHAVNQAVHLSFATRQSRKGDISSWKAYAPAQAGKIAIEAVDRAMRGEGAPNPIYEGDDSVIAWMLAGSEAEYRVELPARRERPRGILETYPKAHSAEYQAQAMIDLACEMREGLDLRQIGSVTVHTSDHTHTVIGTGSGDPQKLDPNASRETLDHSLMYILAVALEDGAWDHEASYAPERAARPSTVELWRKIATAEDPAWTRRYHEADPSKRAFGGRIEIELTDGAVLVGEKHVADAHANGDRPWTATDYDGKFRELAKSVLDTKEIERLIDLCHRLPGLSASDLRRLNPEASASAIAVTEPTGEGLFDWRKKASDDGR